MLLKHNQPCKWPTAHHPLCFAGFVSNPKATQPPVGTKRATHLKISYLSLKLYLRSFLSRRKEETERENWEQGPHLGWLWLGISWLFGWLGRLVWWSVGWLDGQLCILCPTPWSGLRMARALPEVPATTFSVRNLTQTENLVLLKGPQFCRQGHLLLKTGSSGS